MSRQSKRAGDDRRDPSYVPLDPGDHKRLGRDLDLYASDDQIGPGLPLWLPDGTVIRDELEKLARELEFLGGYQRVATPHITRASLYERSGHLPYYKPHMYPFMGEGDQAVCLKPMNCPHHHRIFAARPRSYRDLPLRLAEHGQVYRYEDSGALSGLLRVRGMCMNDAHIYCAPDQVRGELAAVIAMHQRAYEILGLSGFRLRFSTWDPHDPKGREKYVHDPAAWASSQAAVREVLDASGLPYDEGPGEAAFYGPKIDFQLRSVTGREETASTVQLDFAVPARMGLRYVDADGARRTPYVIHRAPLGTHERFVAFLVEHCGGAFPTWLAPVQVRVLCVSDRFRPYAEGVVDALRSEFVRAELDRSGQRVGRMIREAQVRKIPNVLVIGEREQADGSVTLRRRGERRQRAMPAAELQRRVLAAIRARDDAPLGADAV